MKRTIRRRTEIIIETREITKVYRGGQPVEGPVVEAYGTDLPLLESGELANGTEPQHTLTEQIEEEI